MRRRGARRQACCTVGLMSRLVSRRSPRHEPDHPRQDRSCARSASSGSLHRPSGGRSGPRPLPDDGAPADGHAAAAGPPRRRPRAVSRRSSGSRQRGVHRQGGNVWLTVEAGDTQAVIRVRDNGVGIAPEHHHDLFTMFGQIDTSLERSRGGLGIGLDPGQDARRHARRPGRQACRATDPDTDRVSTVRLPVEHADTAGSAACGGGAVRAARRRVLIVDDSGKTAPSRWRCCWSSAATKPTRHTTDWRQWKRSNGRRPMPGAPRHQPPALNGYEVCRRHPAGGLGKAHDAPSALTGWGQDEDRDRSRDAGSMPAHMVKPADVDALLALLAAVQPVADAESGSRRRRRGSGD